MRASEEVIRILTWIAVSVGAAIGAVIFLFSTFETVSANTKMHVASDSRLERIESKIDTLIQRRCE